MEATIEQLLLSFSVDGESGCWIWRGRTVTNGYAQVKFGGRWQQVHRIVYEHIIGPIPVGLEMDHTCHKSDQCHESGACKHRRCINPFHLEPVTHAENVRRGKAGRLASERAKTLTHCRHGHEYTPENTLWQSAGDGSKSRACRECRRIQEIKRHPEYPPGGRVPVSECRSGHPYDEENTYIHRGKRYCRTCDRLRKRARQAVAA